MIEVSGLNQEFSFQEILRKQDTEMITMANQSNAFGGSGFNFTQEASSSRKMSIESFFYDQVSKSQLSMDEEGRAQEDLLTQSDSSRASEISPHSLIEVTTSKIDNEATTTASTRAPVCKRCNVAIQDRFFLRIDDHCWHESCSCCSTCLLPLTTTCFVINGQIYCKEHYKMKRNMCSGCGVKIQDGDTSMKAADSFFHKSCFKCARCCIQLATGDSFVFTSDPADTKKSLWCHSCWTANSETQDSNLKENLLSSTNLRVNTNDIPSTSQYLFSPKSSTSAISLKSDDEDNSDDDLIDELNEDGHQKKFGNTSKDSLDDKDFIDDGKSKSKRPRTILNAVQRRAFKRAFEISPKPCRKVRETLASETGLTIRVVQVWFQNQRAKIKKLAKRQRTHDAANSHFKTRGFYAYDPLTPLPHQIPPLVVNHEQSVNPEFMRQDMRMNHVQYGHSVGWGTNQGMIGYNESWNPNFNNGEMVGLQCPLTEYDSNFVSEDVAYQTDTKMTIQEKGTLNYGQFVPQPQYYS